jgi:hypothetical protein
MTFTRDPVLTPIREWRKEADKRTFEGKWFATEADGVIEAVKEERKANAETLQAMQEETARANERAAAAEMDLEMAALQVEENGYEHKFEPGRGRFSVGEIEEAMVRLRMAGARENTEVRVKYDEMTASTRQPLPLPFEEERAIRKAREKEERKSFWLKVGIWSGALTFGPLCAMLAIKLLATTYNATLGMMF